MFSACFQEITTASMLVIVFTGTTCSDQHRGSHTVRHCDSLQSELVYGTLRVKTDEDGNKESVYSGGHTDATCCLLLHN